MKNFLRRKKTWGCLKDYVPDSKTKNKTGVLGLRNAR